VAYTVLVYYYITLLYIIYIVYITIILYYYIIIYYISILMSMLQICTDVTTVLSCLSTCSNNRFI